MCFVKMFEQFDLVLEKGLKIKKFVKNGIGTILLKHNHFFVLNKNFKVNIWNYLQLFKF